MFLFGNAPIPVTADQPLRSVFVRDLPVEVPDADVKSVFESFGVVHSVHPCFFREFPSVANGTRRLVTSFRRLCPCLTSLCVFSILVSLLRVLSVMNPVTCLGTALFRVCACAASSQITWPEIVRSPWVRPVPVLLCLIRLRLFPLSPVFVVICTRFHYPIYACAIRSVIRYCPVHFCVCSCAISPVSGTYYS